MGERLFENGLKLRNTCSVSVVFLKGGGFIEAIKK